MINEITNSYLLLCSTVWHIACCYNEEMHGEEEAVLNLRFRILVQFFLFKIGFKKF